MRTIAENFEHVATDPTIGCPSFSLHAKFGGWRYICQTSRVRGIVAGYSIEYRWCDARSDSTVSAEAIEFDSLLGFDAPVL